MASDLLLPLFPLEVVLLPQTQLPLHIFEERYKLMIGEATEKGSEFGIVQAKEKAVLNVGCTAAVEKVLKKYDDGRMDIVTVGRRRFEILFLDQQKPYLQAGVHFFDDDPETAAPAEAKKRLDSAFEKVLELLPGGRPELGEGVSTFQIAGALPLDLDFKQQLLSSRSEAERAETLAEHLEKLAVRLRVARRVEHLSRGNGRARKG